ncbi:MAG: hypothetical protein VXZ38_05605 [Planctomycetota bacterium]|nr:hypothetical protein [Planctomycetota bacterium]
MQLPIHSVRVTTAISYSSTKVHSGETQEVVENVRINDKLSDRHTITSKATESTCTGDRNPDGRYQQSNVNDLNDPSKGSNDHHNPSHESFYSTKDRSEEEAIPDSCEIDTDLWVLAKEKQVTPNPPPHSPPPNNTPPSNEGNRSHSVDYHA